MNAMDLFTAPLAQAVGWALLHLLWQATIVAGILATALALLKGHSANVRYLASCTALTIVFALFIGTAYRAYEPALTPIKSDAVEMVPVTQVPLLIAAAAADTWRDKTMSVLAAAQQSLPSVVAIWLVGVIVLSARLLVSWVRARRLVSHGTQDASAQWQRVAARLSDALGLRRAVRLFESAAVEVPSVIGTLRPVILIPASALTGMTPEQIEMVLAHELAHIRRHDFFVNLLQAMVETLMFYHPAVWWMSRRVRIERENCCDDLAVAVCGNPLQYARALTRLEELRAHAPAMTVAANGGSLIQRIRRLVAERAESTSSTSRWTAAIAMLSIVVIALAVPSLPALADRDDDKKKPAAEQPATTSPKSEVEVNAATTEESDLEEAIEEADVEETDVEEADTEEMGIAVAVPVIAPAPTPAPRVAPRPGRPAIAPMPPTASPRAMAAMDAAAAAFAMTDDDEEPSRRRADGKMGTSGKLTVDELIQLRVMGVTPEYVEQVRAVLPGVTLGGVLRMKTHGVSGDWVREMRAAGVDIRGANDAIKLAIHGVNAAWVKKLAAAGYPNLSVNELARLAVHGVNEDFIREMSKYRDNN